MTRMPLDLEEPIDVSGARPGLFFVAGVLAVGGLLVGASVGGGAGVVGGLGVLAVASGFLWAGIRVRRCHLTEEGLWRVSWVDAVFTPWAKVETIVVSVTDRCPAITLRALDGESVRMSLEVADLESVGDWLLEQCPWAILDDRRTGEILEPRVPMPSAEPTEHGLEDRTAAAVERAEGSRRRLATVRVVCGLTAALSGAVGLLLIAATGHVGAAIPMLVALGGGVAFVLSGRRTASRARDEGR